MKQSKTRKFLKQHKKGIIWGIVIISYIAIILPICILLTGNQWENNAQNTDRISETTSIQKIKFSANQEQFTKQLKNYFKENKLNVVAMTTFKGSNQVVTASNGTLASFSNEPLNDQSIFGLASTQKIFTAVVIQKLINQGLIKADEPLSDFYPKIVNSKKITILNLLTHTSGLIDGQYGGFKHISSEEGQVNYVIHHMIQGGKVQYTYASANYTLLAGIIRQVTGKSYKENVEQDIIKPLHLQHTYFYQDLPDDANLVYPQYVKTPLEKRFFRYDIKKQMSYLIGAGQMYASASDYFTFIKALIDGQIIPKPQLENFYPRENHNYINGGYNYFGLFEAGGSQNGYNATFITNPKTKAITVLFSSNFMLVPNKMLTVNLFTIANRSLPAGQWFPAY